MVNNCYSCTPASSYGGLTAQGGLANEISGNQGYNPLIQQNDPHKLGNETESNPLYATGLSEDGNSAQLSYMGQINPDGSLDYLSIKPEDEDEKKKKQEDDLTSKTISFDLNPKEQNEIVFKTDGNASSASVHYNPQDLEKVVNDRQTLADSEENDPIKRIMNRNR